MRNDSMHEDTTLWYITILLQKLKERDLHNEIHMQVFTLVMKANETHYFSNFFDKVLLHVLDRSTVHQQEYLSIVYRQ